MVENYCGNCFCQNADRDAPCPQCGYDPVADRDKFPFSLPRGSILAGRYITGRVLGQGGFGITYLALDNQTKTRVAIKEFMPDSMAVRTAGTPQITVYTGQRQENFRYGMERFLDEAKVLARFQDNPHIVGVRRYFEENGTAYFVMEYVEGVSFKTYIKEHGGKILWEEAVGLLMPVMDALDAVHKEGIIHRDVTPDNIFITGGGGVKLLDFGSARYSLGDKSRSLDVVLKAGYAPKEQYTRRGRQGPYTDVYSLAACLYSAVTGYLPPESLDRADEDDLVLPSTRGVSIPQAVEDVILHGLEVRPADRFQSMGEFRSALAEAMAESAEEPAPVLPEPIPEAGPDLKDPSPVREGPDKAGAQTIAAPVVDPPRQETAEEPLPEETDKRGSIFSGKVKYAALAACCVLIVCVIAVAGGFGGSSKTPAAVVDQGPGVDSAGQDEKDAEEQTDNEEENVENDPAGDEENVENDPAGDEENAAGIVSPVSEDGEAEQAVSQPPASTEPKAEEPKAAEPKATEPKAEEPKAEEPKTTEPKAAEPKAEEPAAAPAAKSDSIKITLHSYTMSVKYLVKTKSSPNIETTFASAGGEALVDQMGLAASQGRLLLLEARRADTKNQLDYLKEATPRTEELSGSYSGGWSGDKPNGQGTFIATSSTYGRVWTGTWKDGSMTHGKCEYPNGDRYEGDLADGSPNGYGVMMYKNGDRYEGNWKNGMWHGSGTVTRADGTSETKTWYHNSDMDVITNLEAQLKAIEDQLAGPDKEISGNIEGSFKNFS